MYELIEEGKDYRIFRFIDKYGNIVIKEIKYYLTKLHSCNFTKIKQVSYFDKSWNNHCFYDKPCYFYFSKEGKCTHKQYKKEGIMHRDGDKPAHIYLVGGKIDKMYYYKEGKIHRSNDKPALYSYYTYSDYNGLMREEYIINGNIHREDFEPAVLWYDIHGNITRRQYFIHKREIKGNELELELKKKKRKIILKDIKYEEK